MDKNELALKKLELEQEHERHLSKVSYRSFLTKKLLEIADRFTATPFIAMYIIIYCTHSGLLTHEQFSRYTEIWLAKVLDESTWQGYLIFGETLLLVIVGIMYAVAEFKRIPKLEKQIVQYQEKYELKVSKT